MSWLSKLARRAAGSTNRSLRLALVYSCSRLIFFCHGGTHPTAPKLGHSQSTPNPTSLGMYAVSREWHPICGEIFIFHINMQTGLLCELWQKPTKRRCRSPSRRTSLPCPFLSRSNQLLILRCTNTSYQFMARLYILVQLLM